MMKRSLCCILALAGLPCGEALHLQRRAIGVRARRHVVLSSGAALRSTEGERGDVRAIGVLALPALVSQLTDPFLSVGQHTPS